MNNFSDLLDTKQQLNLTIKLGVITDNGCPGVSLRVNNDVIEYLQLSSAVGHSFDLSIVDPIEIEISMTDKEYSEHQETAVLIESINIDGFEIVPQWTHLAEYHSERGLQGPTSYLGINGSWKLTIDRPFYQWRHHITGQGWLLEPISYEES
jgi:hypothetical protein